MWIKLTRHLVRLAGIIALLLFLAACAATGSTTTESSATPTPAFPPGSPEAQGAALFSGKGRCAACHSLSPGTVIVGPSLAGIAARAATRVPGLSAAAYLDESIVRPDVYRPPGFENEQMDTSLAKQLTVEEIEALVAYLLTLE